MKKFQLFFRFVLIIVILLPGSSVLADNGVDDLRGRWDVEVTFLDSEGNPLESLPPLILYVNEMRASVYLENTFYAGGCMRSPGSDVFMPLSVRAVFNETDNTYDTTIYSTFVPGNEGGQPFVMRLTGTIVINGYGVSDDTVTGAVTTEFTTGEWSGIHHDRRKTKCPSVFGSNFGVQGDVYVHQDLGPNPAVTIYEMHTIIVSSGLLVEAPDGTQMVAQEYTDIFSPDVDFIGRFRYVSVLEGLPMTGGTYQFTLLDVFGDPIPGTESTDVWFGCNQAAPVNVNAGRVGDDVLLQWDVVPDVPGEFEPWANPQIGFYQIGIHPYNWEGTSSFGSNLIKSTSHFIPWAHFEPGTPGTPDGDNYGIALSEFEDGAYQVDVSAFGEANPVNGGKGLECAVFDTTEKTIITKDGENIHIETFGTISGYVYDEEGNPLGNIAVDIEDGGYGACTDEFGYYELQGLPTGNYNIAAGRDFCSPHPFAEQVQFDIPVDSTDVNFYLSPVGPDQPVLHIVPAHPEIHGHGWDPNLAVTIFVDTDDNLGNGYLYTQTKGVNDEPTWCNAPCFDVSNVEALPDSILPGYVVTMTNGEATRVVHTTSLVWTGTDTEAETVFGTADSYTWIEVIIHGPEHAIRIVQADEFGNWSADFSTPGPQEFEQETADLEPGYHGRSIEFEGGVPDDGTLAYWYIEEPPQPNMVVQPDHEWAFGYGWAVGDEVSLCIDDNGDPLDGCDLALTQTAYPSGDPNDDPEIGEVWFGNWEAFDLMPGLFVTMSGSSFTRTLHVETLTVDSFDENTLVVSGTVSPGVEREVGIGVHQPDGDFWMVVLSDINGNWSADFSGQGVDAPNVFDIHVMIWDEDRDATQANYNFP